MMERNDCEFSKQVNLIGSTKKINKNYIFFYFFIVLNDLLHYHNFSIHTTHSDMVLIVHSYVMLQNRNISNIDVFEIASSLRVLHVTPYTTSCLDDVLKF